METRTTELTFGAAMEELETILRRVEGEEIDIDELADELKRAAELLDTCRAKIRRAEVEVSQIVQTLEDPPPQTRQAEQDSDEPGPEKAQPPETASLFGTDD